MVVLWWLFALLATTTATQGVEVQERCSSEYSLPSLYCDTAELLRDMDAMEGNVVRFDDYQTGALVEVNTLKLGDIEGSFSVAGWMKVADTWPTSFAHAMIASKDTCGEAVNQFRLEILSSRHIAFFHEGIENVLYLSLFVLFFSFVVSSFMRGVQYTYACIL